ncbi:MAG: hypothetical protein AAGK37_07900 [Pseudomonadota bacterium]
MNDRPEPMFLARETYRRRRLMDAARFLPFLGFFIFVVPTLWADGAGTAIGLVYLFAAWAILIVMAYLIARPLRDVDPQAGEADDPDRAD